MPGFLSTWLQTGPFYVTISANRLAVRDIVQGKTVELQPLVCIDRRQKPERILAVGEAAQQANRAEGCEIVNPFAHPRTLLADFTVAEKLLQHAVHQLATNALLRPSPLMILHPLEKTEGGLTQVEVRAWQELAAGAGARSAAVWVGGELSDADILDCRYPGDAWLPEPPKWARRR
ncbi:Rod shape-determining protein MreB [Thiorhodovibrio litoralis]|nr:hypothetical protein [Thiorhodovibrio winogradskyi]WPL13255.1 Rod shape-determining protein MreB [Thiorhodovibrio litoralis]